MARPFVVATRPSRPRALAEDPVVIGVVSDPEPDEAVFRLDGQCPVVGSDACGPVGADLLQADRRMMGICLEQGKCFIGELLNLGGQRMVTRPEVW